MENNRIIVKIGSESVDFTDVPIITGGDKKSLFKLGVNFNKLSEMDPDVEGKLILYLIQKVHPRATEAEVDAIPLNIQQSILAHFTKKTREIDNPFSHASPSSPENTGGAKPS